MPGSAAVPIVRTNETLICDQLLVRIARGDSSAFEVLYGQQMPAVRQLAGHLLRDSFQADEVAQEVMLAIWQRAGQFDPSRGTGPAWIMRMTRSKAIDRIRMAERSRARDRTYAGQTASAGLDADVVDLALARLDSARTQLALLSISPIQREALVLAYFSRLTYPQIAAALDLPLGTLKTRIRDGLIKMRGILGDSAAEVAA